MNKLRIPNNKMMMFIIITITTIQPITGRTHRLPHTTGRRVPQAVA